MDGTKSGSLQRAFVTFGIILALTAARNSIAAAPPSPQPQPKAESVLPTVVKAAGLSRSAMSDRQPIVSSDGRLNPAALSKEPVGLHDQIVVQVDNLRAWAGGDTTKLASLVLYLDGKALPDERPLTDLWHDNILVFDLVRTDQTKAVWRMLLGKPCDPDCSSRTVRLTVGPEGQGPFSSSALVDLRVMRTGWVWAFVISMSVLLFALFGRESTRAAAQDLLRDNDTNRKPGPYSLARLQMALWFVTVIIAYVYIYMVTGYYDVLSQSVLALIGISAGTTAFAAVVDNTPRKEARDSLKQAQQEIKKLDEEIATNRIAADPQAMAALVASKTEAQQHADEVNAVANPKSTNLLTDILSFGGSDTALHRVQMLVWTAILWVIFVREVYSTLSMPDFSPELLGLMGISSGTYLGFKVVTQKTSAGKA